MSVFNKTNDVLIVDTGYINKLTFSVLLHHLVLVIIIRNIIKGLSLCLND